MARSRNIKPAIMDNEELAELPPLTRLLFIYLWMLADREGRLEDRPKRIAAQALPYDRGADADSMLNDLQKAGFIVRYEAGEIKCIQVVAFTKHQSPHVRESASELPSMEQGTAKVVPEHNLGSAKPSPGSPDSLIPDSLIPDTGLGTGAETARTTTQKKARASAKLLSLEDLVAEGVDRLHAEDWLAVRKKKDMPLTLTAWNAVKREAEKAGMDVARAVMCAAENSWAGFKAEWLARQSGGGFGANKQELIERQNQAALDEWLGKGEVVDV